MSLKTGGSISTLLLSLPLAGVALMAIFGVPQFAPVIASSNDEAGIRSAGRRVQRGRQPEDFLDDFPAVELNGNQAFADDAPAYRSAQDARDQRRSNPGANWDRESVDRLDPAQDSPWPGSDSVVERRRDEYNHDPRPFPGASPRREENFSRVEPGLERSAQVTSEPDFPAAPRSGSMGWKEAARHLHEIGVEKFHLERGQTEGTFLFVCLFSPAETPDVTQRFEAEAEDPLEAVNKVLVQIDDWLKRRFSSRPAVTLGHRL